MFLNNKYTIWYNSIIERAKDRNWSKKTAPVYVEGHHILPKSIVPNNDIVYLTAREHYICHLLLPKMLEGENRRKMIFALLRLVTGNKNVVYCESSYAYEQIKIKNSKASSERSKSYWSTVPKTVRSEMRRGEKNGRFGKVVSEETRKKISKANKGKLIGEMHPLWNKAHSEDSKEKMSRNRKGKAVGSANPMFGKSASKGKKWFNNGVIERYFKVDQVPEGFIQGRLR